MSRADTQSFRHYLAPRFWPTWLAHGAIWLAARLPFRWQMAIGRDIGRLSYHFARRRRQICETNIALCFPELSEDQQRRLVKDTFLSNGMGIMEIGLSWYRRPEEFMDRVTAHGVEHVEAARAQGRGVLLVSAHFCTLELIGGLTAQLFPVDITYRAHKNPLFDALMKRGREQHFGAVVERRQVRLALRRLREGHALWYAADQDYGPKHSIFAPFFNRPAATITATSRFARYNDSPVIFFAHYRTPDHQGYELYFSEPLENYPTGDDVEDATRINGLIEAAIRRHPEQYIWLHRRFKTRPEGTPDPYREHRKGLA
ncbi:MAG: LpxL/LpxP family Kdo(2)-lipid IV(A) lauroyl/palmitoleoyl acyltransferase [Pseudomonadota bacterium]